MDVKAIYGRGSEMSYPTESRTQVSEATPNTRYSYEITHWGKRERVIAKLKIITYGVGAAAAGALTTLAGLGIFS